MDCRDARTHLLDYQRGRLAPNRSGNVRAHLGACLACHHDDAAERMLNELLEGRLPQHPASLALKRRLAAQWVASPVPRRSWWSRWDRRLVPALAAALVLVVIAPVSYEWVMVQQTRETAGLVAEAVNDHLRLLSGHHPLEVESGGIHQVKPWFTGRLDFAPIVAFGGDAEFPLRGGAIEYFRDRPAAVFVYTRRLHTVSLFVFRGEGLPWPTHGLRRLGGRKALTQVERGFSVILWRAGELGYAVVSDLDAAELFGLAARLTS
jgi:anti-sigma factor RsiW